MFSELDVIDRGSMVPRFNVPEVRCCGEIKPFENYGDTSDKTKRMYHYEVTAKV